MFPRASAIPLLTALGMLGSACSSNLGGPPEVIANSPFGSSVIYPGGQPTPDGGTAAPPANLEPGRPPAMAEGGARGPAPSPGRSGVYSGIAYPLDTAGGLCITNRRINGFVVKGNKVRWGGFRGTIDGDGLQMVNGNTWFFGQFEGDVFQGQISTYRRLGTPGCTFSVQLAKTGN